MLKRKTVKSAKGGRFSEILKRAKENPEYWVESARLDFTEALVARLKEIGMSHYRLHKLSGVSKGQVSKTLAHHPNLTIETMTKLALATGMRVRITMTPIESEANGISGDFCYRVLTCVYCGHEYPQDTPAWGHQVLTEHIKVCEKHPMRKLEADNARLRKALSELKADTKPSKL